MATLPVEADAGIIFDRHAYVPFQATFDDIDSLTGREVVAVWDAVRQFLAEAVGRAAPDDLRSLLANADVGEAIVLLNGLEVGSLKFRGYVLSALTGLAGVLTAEAITQSEPGKASVEAMTEIINASSRIAVAMGQEAYAAMAVALDDTVQRATDYHGFQVTRYELTANGVELRLRRTAVFDRRSGGSFDL